MEKDSILSEEARVVALKDEAEQVLSSPEGQRILREIDAVKHISHMQMSKKINMHEPVEKLYTGGEYEEFPERFRIAGFRSSFFILEDDSDLILSCKGWYEHRRVLQPILNKKFPHWRGDPNTRLVSGNVVQIKDTDIRFFAVMKGFWNMHKSEPEVARKIASRLFGHGYLLLIYWYDVGWERQQLEKPKYQKYARYLELPFEERVDLPKEETDKINWPEVRFEWELKTPQVP